MRQKFTIGQIMGIPIRLHISWFLVFLLISSIMAMSYYPMKFRNLPAAQYWSLGVLTAFLLFISVLLHELGHSVLARHYKIEVRSITLFFFGGLAEIAHEPKKASEEFWIALAGPATSLALAFLFGSLSLVMNGLAPLLVVIEYISVINTMLVIFNMMPSFPLDGGRVLRSILWAFNKNFSKATMIAANIGRAIAMLFIFGGVWLMLMRDMGSGLWIGFMGWFLLNSASGQIQQQKTQDLLNNHQVSQVMSYNYTSIPAETTLQQLVNGFMLLDTRRNFVVEREGAVLGVLPMKAVKEQPRTNWPTTTVAQIMIPVKPANLIQPDTQLLNAMEEMDRYGLNYLPVAIDGKIVGLLSREGIISYLHSLQEMGMRRANEARGIGD